MADTSQQIQEKLIQQCLPKVVNCANVVYRAVMKTWPVTSGFSRSRILTHVEDDFTGSVSTQDVEYARLIETGESYRPDDKKSISIKRANRKYPHFPRAIEALHDVAENNPDVLVGDIEELDREFWNTTYEST